MYYLDLSYFITQNYSYNWYLRLVHIYTQVLMQVKHFKKNKSKLLLFSWKRLDIDSKTGTTLDP